MKQIAPLARRALENIQAAQKRRYDAKVKVQRFAQGQQVVLLLPSADNKLEVRGQGLYNRDVQHELN